VLNQTFNDLKLEKHPDKTVIGKTERALDFIGYHFRPDHLTIASKTLNILLNVLASFTSKSRGSHSTPPGLESTCSAGLGEYEAEYIRECNLFSTNAPAPHAP